MPSIAKSHPFSVYLLKDGFTSENSLNEDHWLSHVSDANLPLDSVLYVLDRQGKDVWWRLYLGLQAELPQPQKSALLFITNSDRTFAVCFGNVAYNLRNESFEYDFGLRTSLNCVDPKKLRNTDVAEPGSARRQRTQTSTGTDLTYFDFQTDSQVLRSITGAVRSEFSSVAKNITGGSNVRISSKTSAKNLPTLCATLLNIYNREDYRTSFPDIDNVTPVRDPVELGRLDERLLAALRAKDLDSLLLGVPELVDHLDAGHARFSGHGPSKVYPDLHIGGFFEYLADRDIDPLTLSLEDLRTDRVQLYRADDERAKTFQLYRCLIFDTRLDQDDAVYHLLDGNWYRFDGDYIRRLTDSLASILASSNLPVCTQHLEGEYNVYAAKELTNGICLDTTDVSPAGQTQVEPCDVLYERGDRVVLAHVKISTASSQLSHLFNQGANSAELLVSEPAVRDKLMTLLHKLSDDANSVERQSRLIHDRKFSVEYAVITHKASEGGIENLPLFSRISLARAKRSLEAMQIPLSLSFIADQSPDRKAQKAKRKTTASS